MSIVLYHHPFSRAANVVWMLEEVEAPYELRFVDLFKGAHKQPEITRLNPMGKIPILTDGDVVVTESAAIGLYLADAHAYGRLSPKVDDPKRGAFLRWSFFTPSVIEPAVSAKQGKWEVRESQVGWGNCDAMMQTVEHALEGKTWLLGEQFSMADCIFGGTLQFLTMFKAIEAGPRLAAYVERVTARPGWKRAEQKNLAVMKEHGLKMPGT